MGDVRFERPFEQVRDASDRVEAMSSMRDDELVAALAGASRANDPLAANYIATALQNRLARLHAVLDNIGEGVALLDGTGACVSHNASFARLLRRESHEITGHDLHDLVHTKCPTTRPCQIRESTRTETLAKSDEDDFSTGDGGRAPVAWTVQSVVRDGRVTGAVIVVRDVAEMRRSREELARAAALLAASDDAVYTTTTSGTITSWNGGAERLFGCRASDVVGRPAEVFMPPSSSGEGHIIHELVIRQGRPIAFEARRRCKDGRLVDVSLSFSPLKSGSTVEGVLIIARDISAQKREQMLVASILDASPQAILAVREDGRIVFANAKAETLFGYEKGELISRSVDELVPARLRARHLVHRSAYNADPRAMPMGSGLELWAVRKDGTEIPVEISVNPIRAGDLGLVVTSVRQKETEDAPDIPPDPAYRT